MRKKTTLHISLPIDLRDWIEHEAGGHRMSLSDFAVRLMSQGIAAETIDVTVARLEAAVARAGITREVLRQSIATRYLIEQLARGGVKTPATAGYDADQFAERELERIWPQSPAAQGGKA
jgi:hypothetical protein